MSDTPPEFGPDWWKANDGKWYPPHRHPDYVAPEPELPAPPPSASPAPAAPSPKPTVAYKLGRSRVAWLGPVRLIVFALLAIAAVVVAANEPDADSADVVLARISADTNEESASGAPQQTVVNGWEAADLLDVIATRSTDNRVPLLLVIVVFTLCWQFLTAPWANRTDGS